MIGMPVCSYCGHWRCESCERKKNDSKACGCGFCARDMPSFVGFWLDLLGRVMDWGGVKRNLGWNGRGIYRITVR